MITYNGAASDARYPPLLKKPRYGSIGNGPRNGSGRIHAPRRGIFKKIGKFFKHPKKALKLVSKVGGLSPLGLTARGLLGGEDLVDAAKHHKLKKTLTRALKSGGKEAVGRSKATLDFLGGRKTANELRNATKGSKFFDQAFKAYDKGKELHGQARAVSKAARGGLRQFADEDLPNMQRGLRRAGSMARDQAAQAQAQAGQIRGQARQIGEGVGQAQSRMQSDVSQTVRELREAADALGNLGQDFRGGRSAGIAGQGFGMRSHSHKRRRARR